MSSKLDKGSYPAGHSAEDFKCYGPPAVKDGDFANVKICDMGCFTQDGKDSNKMYHAAVVQSKKTSKWYAYFQWGRTGASKPSFQFVECSSESEAQQEFADQCHEKNDKRGQWVTIAGIRTLQAKPGKDCYLVRAMATRSTGLPDAKTIKVNEGAKQANIVETKSVSSSSSRKIDHHTVKLMRDLSVATVTYTRGVMADASLPTQVAIDEGRQILQEAQKRLVVVGDVLEGQIKDKQLMQLTSVLYSRIPKKKPVNAGPETWILSKNNIALWQVDLDAFESSLYSTDIESKSDSDVFAGMPLHMEWIDPSSSLGKFLYKWWPSASANRHSGIGSMRVKNIWKVERNGDQERLERAQDGIIKERISVTERVNFQPSERQDLSDPKLMKKYADTNTNLLFHGTRTVNLTGILRESLRLPKQLVGVVITGAAYGPGLYFASDWKKSAGYTSLQGSYWSGGSGGVRGRDAFMFGVDVVLGSTHIAKGSYGYTSAPRPHHSVYAKAGMSGVMNDEFIIFQPQQHRLRYLAEFST